MKVNESKNTGRVINWLRNTSYKYLCKFLMFDIKNLCSLIKENLLFEFLRFVKHYLSIYNKTSEVVFHARNIFLYNNDQLCIKKEDNNFDKTTSA